MGMDGLSMSNTGIFKEATSAEHTNRTEQTIQGDKTNDPKQVQNLSTNRHVKEKEDEEESPKQKKGNSEGDEEETFNDGIQEQENENDFDIQDLENPNKDFYVKLNSKDDIIELYDSSTDRLIETISGNELTELVRKLNMASGIFVNKKV